MMDDLTFYEAIEFLMSAGIGYSREQAEAKLKELVIAGIVRAELPRQSSDQLH
jgi:hypothetical protein